MSGSTVIKKRGQGKAKGVSQGHNIKCRYPDWMWHLRKDCFEKYLDWEDRYKHPLDDVTPTI
jgi:hypothetical protein